MVAPRRSRVTHGTPNELARMKETHLHPAWPDVEHQSTTREMAQVRVAWL